VSGTSAGAVVATLVWAGYTPKEIRDMFVQLAIGSDQEPQHTSRRETLLHLLNPVGEAPATYHYNRFRVLADSIEGHLRQFAHFATVATEHSGIRLWWRLSLVRRVDFVAAILAWLLMAIVGFGLWNWRGYPAHTVKMAWLQRLHWPFRGVAALDAPQN
jgi:hypothetical protein